MGFWKTLGKIGSIAAPIIAAPFTGGTSLALIGAGAGAAGGALQGGKKGALIGGLLGGATAGLGGGGGAATKGAGQVAKAGIGSTLKNVGGNLVSKLLSGDVLDATGKGVGAIANTEAHNRGTKLDATMTADEMKMKADEVNRAANKEGLRNMQIAEYLSQGGFQPVDNPTLSNGRQATKFDFGTRPATEVERNYGAGMSGVIADRLAHPVQLSDYSKMMDPGAMEKTLNWLSPILTTVGAARGSNQYMSPEEIAKLRTQTQPQAAPALPPVEFKPSSINAGARNPYDVTF